MMVETIKRLFSPPIYPEDENKTRVANLMHIILLALLVLLSFNTAVSYLFGDEALAIAINAATVLVTAGLFALLHSGRVRLSAIITVSLFWGVVTLVSFFISGFTIIIVSSYFVLVFLAGTVINKRAGILFAFLSIAAGVLTYIIEASELMVAAIPVIPAIAVSATAVNLLAMAVILYLNLQNLENALERLQKTQKEMTDAQAKLEERVAERTRDLALTNDIGRSISAIRHVDALLTSAVEVIQSYFKLYYAQIYLVNETENKLELRAAYGQAAERILRQGHYLPFNTASINVTAVLQKRSILVPNTADDPLFRPHPLLPNTRSEMSIPLLIADKVLGVLDLQSAVPFGLTTDNLPSFEALTAQIAIALENAGLFSEREETAHALQTLLADMEARSRQEAILANLSATLSTANSAAEVYDLAGQQIIELVNGHPVAITSITEDGTSFETFSLSGDNKAIPSGSQMPIADTAVGLAITHNQTIRLPQDFPFSAHPDSSTLAQGGWQSLVLAPLSAEGQAFGTLNIGSVQPNAFTDEIIVLIQQIAALIATRLENIRLADRVGLLADIVENHPDFISAAALDGRIIYANHSALALLDLPTDQIITNKTITDLYAEEERDAITQTSIPQALQSGSWTGQAHLRTSNDQLIPVELTISANRDAQKAPTNFSITMRDITDRLEAVQAQHRLTVQLEERLLQVNALQRTMTHEGWSEFLTSPNRLIQGFTFDDERIRLLSTRDLLKPEIPKLPSAAETSSDDATTLAAPILVRGETIGVLGARNPSGEPINRDQQEMLTALASEVAEALDRARLFEEMQMAQTQMEKLFAGSERVVQANTIQGVLNSLVESTELNQMDRVSFMFFDRSWDTQQPESMSVTAAWNRNGKSAESAIGLTYHLADLPSFRHISRHEPTIFHNLDNDDRVGEDVQSLANKLGAKSAAYFPLIAGDQWFGLLAAQSDSLLNLTDADIRQISSLTSQAASVSLTQRLFEQTQARAQTEQTLREVTARVFAAADADTILRTAAREVNRVLGLETYVYLTPTDIQAAGQGNGHSEERSEL
ncbi:MAG: GAF domain-containing protein [Chloroflexi bacterium]|nr:GAF domain-containing protein [Chloroflexota bacterium]MBP7044893.1 GAF domain-containing protein [Chloroflexota bacterium]